MNNEDLLEAIGEADEKMLEQSEKRRNVKMLSIVATAAVACFALLFCVFGQHFLPTDIGPAHYIVEDNLPLFGELTYDPDGYIGSSSGNSGGMLTQMKAVYQFGRAKSIQVEIKEVLPDTYCRAGSTQAYRILRLKVIDSIVGENIPDEIFYLLPAYLSVDILDYDCFIMTIEQQGLENYVMINATQKRAEAFTFLFAASTVSNPSYGSILAFSNDQLDVSLWDREGWGQKKDEVINWLSDCDCVEYPGKFNRNIEDTKKAILEARAMMDSRFYDLTEILTSDVFAYREAKKALAHIESSGDGAFWHIAYYDENFGALNGKMRKIQANYRRVINGCYTNEIVTISTMIGDDNHMYDSAIRVTYPQEHFTEADIEKLPDVASFINNIGAISPPVRESGAEVYLANAIGYYEKYNGVVFGFVRCIWRYEENGEWKTMNTYYLIYPDNTYQEAGIIGGDKTTFYMKEWIAKHAQ